MKVLVTGGSGYIGSHTIIELLEDGFEPVSIDNFINSTPESFDWIEEVTGQRIRNYNVDLRILKDTEQVFKKENNIKGVIHFAALKAVGESVEKPLLYFENNNSSLINILRCTRKFNVPNFIFSSSCSVYGNVQELPVNEATPLSKTESPYASTKQMGEEIIRHFQKQSNSSSIALRYFNPVGAHKSGLIGENPINKPNNLVPVITQTAAGLMDKMLVHGNDYDTRDGSCIRDYVHVSDIARAHVKALSYLVGKKNSSNFEIFNLGTGNGVSVFEAISAFEKVSGKKLDYGIGPRRAGDVANIYSDSSKAGQELGWRPKFNIEDMMSTAWQWQQHILNKQKA